MARKRPAASKRKAEVESSAEDDPLSTSDKSLEEERAPKRQKTSAKAKKGAAKAKASQATAESSSKSGSQDGGEPAQPTNKVMPAQVSFPSKAQGAVRIATWNICGLAAAQKKGFKTYVDAEDADILILTETKVNNPPADPDLSERYPHRYWAISDKKTYSGTAILSKIKPLTIKYEIPGHPDTSAVKGRIVTVEFESCYVIGTYVTNAGTGLKTLDAKKEWNKHFELYIRELDKQKPVIWTGDLNVAPTALDLTNPRTNWNKTPGYTEAETSAFARILNSDGAEPDAAQFVDVWRKRHPNLRHFSYFSYRFNCREKGIGWRLDMFVLSARLQERVQSCEIRSEIYGASDHCPVVLELKGPI